MVSQIAQLFEAAWSGNAEQLAASLAAGVDPNARDGEQRTALFYAAPKGNTACVAALLTAGADPNATDLNDRSPLYWAAFAHGDPTGMEQCTAALLAAGADPFAQAFECTAAHNAARWGSTAVLSALLAAAPGAALLRDSQGYTPLQQALCGWRHKEARFLLTHGLPQPPGEVLPLLLIGNGYRFCYKREQPLYVPLADRQTLTASEWAMVPAPCDGLGAALPAVLQRSTQEAALLVRRLPAADRTRLRTAALCLARAQRVLGTPLPNPILGCMLALSLSDHSRV